MSSKTKEENHHSWKGDNVGYQALHTWVRKHLGKASKCSININHKSKKFEWSNISGLYKRELSDYRELCKSCHAKFDTSEKMRVHGKEMLTRNQFRIKAVKQYDINGKLIKSYKSITIASKETGIDRSSISNMLNGRYKLAGNYIWKGGDL